MTEIRILDICVLLTGILTLYVSGVNIWHAIRTSSSQEQLTAEKKSSIYQYENTSTQEGINLPMASIRTHLSQDERSKEPFTEKWILSKSKLSPSYLAGLVKRAEQGEQMAQKELYEQYSLPMFIVSMKITGNEDVAIDVVKNSFIVAYNTISAFPIQNISFKSWLKQIVVNESKLKIRSQKLKPETKEYSSFFSSMQEKQIQST
ncbi:RNA polymerase sigma factor [Spirosoma agri]|uniref:RNA polymerase sigma-70 region 2 domain-containing protein n=1 Tax=Spirosoma agri TaxID=1987381 RepID=A0A6M0IHL5_9BACT|nr:hypothetical protein [Spirosoma agri]NEU67769.1 hypothetical protein [Spirosoma agri]